MKIAILTPTFSHYSGIDRVAEQQASEYSKKVNKVTVFALEADIKPKNFDIVISHFYPMNLIASKAKKKYGIKYVYHNHGIGYSELFGNIFEKAYIKLF